MKEFNQLCNEVEKMEVLTYGAVLADKATDIIPALSVIMEDEVDGLTIFATFILAFIFCIAASFLFSLISFCFSIIILFISFDV